MEAGFCTEAEVKVILTEICKGTGNRSPYIFVSKREQGTRSYMRVVTFVIRTEEGNEELVDAINKWSVKNDRKLEFYWSEINLQNGNLDVDYLMIRAYISPNLT